MADLTKATELDPQHLEAYYQLGLAYQKLGDRTKATTAFKKFEQLKAAKADPAKAQDADTLLSLADTYYRLQKPEEASQTVSRLSLLAEKDPQLRLHLGLLLIENEQAPEALDNSNLPASSFSRALHLRLGWEALICNCSGRPRRQHLSRKRFA